MTRTEIIAQLDAELNRLERARDFLTAALKGSPLVLKNSLLTRVTKRLPSPVVAAKAASVKATPVPAKAVTVSAKADSIAAKAVAISAKADSIKTRKKAGPVVAASVPAATAVAAALAPQTRQEPEVHRVPPKRRMERRQLQTDKNKSGAALSGAVPAGPVAVSASAVEARKVQERAVPAPQTPMVSELRSEIGSERSLGSLIQAFERRTGLSGLEIP